MHSVLTAFHNNAVFSGVSLIYSLKYIRCTSEDPIFHFGKQAIMWTGISTLENTPVAWFVFYVYIYYICNYLFHRHYFKLICKVHDPYLVKIRPSSRTQHRSHHWRQIAKSMMQPTPPWLTGRCWHLPALLPRRAACSASPHPLAACSLHHLPALLPRRAACSASPHPLAACSLHYTCLPFRLRATRWYFRSRRILWGVLRVSPFLFKSGQAKLVVNLIFCDADCPRFPVHRRGGTIADHGYNYHSISSPHSQTPPAPIIQIKESFGQACQSHVWHMTNPLLLRGIRILLWLWFL